MNSSDTRLLLGDNYQYSLIGNIFTENELKKYEQSIYDSFNKIDWDDRKYSEWIIRNYLGIKMILSSSIMLTSCKYAMDKNIRMVEPYLFYYSLFNCSRCYLFTNPNVDWNDGEIIELNHTKIINNTTNYIRVLNKSFGDKFEEDMNLLKYYRELFSYRFPANGLKSINNNIAFNDIVEKCKLLCELAQFNSFLLHKSFNKDNIGKKYNFISEYMDKGYLYEGINECIIDDEDLYRINYILKKHENIYSLYHTMTEGMIEDFFGAWYSDIDGYNPDENWRIIFNVP